MKLKVKFLSNNIKWNVKEQLRKLEKEFSKCGIDLDIDVDKTSLPIKWDITWGNPVYTELQWFYDTIIPQGKGSHIVALGIDEKDWKPADAGGWHKSPYNGVHGIETKIYRENKKVKSGKYWLVHILAHEISHVLFHMERMATGNYDKIDQTHNYLYNSNPKFQLKECLSHLDLKAIKKFLKN